MKAKELSKCLPTVRRSVRDPQQAQLETSQVQGLLQKIRANDSETVVLKIKDHLKADINSLVMDAIIEALWTNTVCQALYVQNHNKALHHPQLMALIALLKKKKRLWCLNIGENYEISNDDWAFFDESLPATSITHLYVSEHVISNELKNSMRAHIRSNRSKHDLHCNLNNLAVIERCTHCWWNPINTIRHAMALNQATCLQKTQRIRKESAPWKFACSCKEVCSSYENVLYQPKGRMFQCSLCTIWAHVACVLGDKVSDDDIEEMEYVLCHVCKARVDRDRRHAVDPSVEMWKIRARSLDEILKPPPPAPAVDAATADEWHFKCKCGEQCSSYENVRYHPVGRTYQCTACTVWSHVLCVLGERITDEELQAMQEVLCFSCLTKERRKKSRVEAKRSGKESCLMHEEAELKKTEEAAATATAVVEAPPAVEEGVEAGSSEGLYW